MKTSFRFVALAAFVFGVLVSGASAQSPTTRLEILPPSPGMTLDYVGLSHDGFKNTSGTFTAVDVAHFELSGPAGKRAADIGCRNGTYYVRLDDHALTYPGSAAPGTAYGKALHNTLLLALVTGKTIRTLDYYLDTTTTSSPYFCIVTTIKLNP